MWGPRVARAACWTPPHPRGDAASEQVQPAIAFGSGEYLVVWEDPGQGPQRTICGARLDPNGAVLDPAGFHISTARPHSDPCVAASASGFLVGWEDIATTAWATTPTSSPPA